MALTIDRSLSGWSAADLNSLFDDLKAQLVATLPSSIANQCDSTIANLSIEEIDEIAAGIESPRDIAEAIAYLGQRLAEECADEAEGDGNSSWVFGYVPASSLGASAQSWLISIVQKAEEQHQALEEAQAELGQELKAGAALYGQIMDSMLTTMSAQNAANEAFYSQLWLLSEEERADATWILTDPTMGAGTAANLFVAQYQQLSNTSTSSIWNGTQFNRTPISLLGGFTQNSISLVSGGARNMSRTFTSGAVQPMSYSGGSTFSFSFTEEEVDGGLSDTYDLPLVTKEPFEGAGFNEWYPSPPTGSALTTITIETYEEVKSVTSFYPPLLARLTTEPFSLGYSEGAQPASCGNNTSTSFKTEDLTSQVDGSSTTFSLSNQYKSGTLRVYWNGQRQIAGDTITELNNTQFSTSFTAPVGTAINVDYTPSDC